MGKDTVPSAVGLFHEAAELCSSVPDGKIPLGLHN